MNDLFEALLGTFFPFRIVFSALLGVFFAYALVKLFGIDPSLKWPYIVGGILGLLYGWRGYLRSSD